MITHKKIGILFVIGATSVLNGMQSKRVYTPYVQPMTMVQSPAAAQAVALSVVKPKIANVPVSTYQTAVASSQQRATACNTASYASMQVSAMQRLRAQAVADFTAAFTNKGRVEQIAKLKTVRATLECATRNLTSLEKQLEKQLMAKQGAVREGLQTIIRSTKNSIAVESAYLDAGIRIFSEQLLAEFYAGDDLEAHVSQVFKLISLHYQLDQMGASKEVREACDCVLQKCTVALKGGFTVCCNQKPNWFQDCFFCWLLGWREKERRWQELQAAKGEVLGFLGNWNISQEFFIGKDPRSTLEMLYKSRLVFEHFDRYVDKLGWFGLDEINADRVEYKKLRGDVAAYKAIIDASIKSIESNGVCSVVRFVKNIAMPCCLKGLNNKWNFGNYPVLLWHTYEQEIRDFVINCYDLSTRYNNCFIQQDQADPWQEFIGGADMERMVIGYERLMRKLIKVCELKALLQVLEQLGLNIFDPEEHRRAYEEVSAMTDCLTDMVETCCKMIKSQLPAMQLKNFQEIINDMEMETWRAEWEKRRNEPVAGKMINFLTQDLCQLSTNFHDASKLSLDLLEIDLFQAKENDIRDAKVKDLQQCSEQEPQSLCPAQPVLDKRQAEIAAAASASHSALAATEDQALSPTGLSTQAKESKKKKEQSDAKKSPSRVIQADSGEILRGSLQISSKQQNADEVYEEGSVG